MLLKVLIHRIINVVKNARCSAAISLILALCVVSSAFAKNSKRLETTATVVAYERLSGHIYDSSKVDPRFLLVKIDSVVKGNIDSEFALIKYLWRLDDKNTPTDQEYLSQWNFTLSRDNSCSQPLRTIYSYDGVEPRFDRILGDQAGLPQFEQKLPCYILKRGNFKHVRSTPVKTDVEGLTDKDFFLLEKNRWKNQEDAPVKFQVVGGRRSVSIFNMSNKPIEGYKTACIKNTAPSTFSNTEEVKENLSPGAGRIKRDPFRTTSDDLRIRFETCVKQDAYLGIVEAAFSNGSTWHLREK